MNNDIHVYALSGIDPAVADCTLGGWAIKISCAESDGTCLIPEHRIFKILYQTFVQSNLHLIHYCPSPEAPQFVYLIPRTQNFFAIKPVITTLRLFKLSEIGMSYPLSFNQAGGCIGNVVYDYHSAHYIEGIPSFSLSEEEREQIQVFYELVAKCQVKHIQHMIQLFHEAYRMQDARLAFILRVTILEMLIKGPGGVKDRMSRSVGTLLVRSTEDREQIREKCRVIYKAGSEFLHDGKTDKITPEAKLLALDYARRVIANLICIGEDIDRVRKMLDVSGFGENPFQVQF